MRGLFTLNSCKNRLLHPNPKVYIYIYIYIVLQIVLYNPKVYIVLQIVLHNPKVWYWRNENKYFFLGMEAKRSEARAKDRILAQCATVPLECFKTFCFTPEKYGINEDTQGPLQGFGLFKQCVEVLFDFQPEASRLGISKQEWLQTLRQEWLQALRKTECGIIPKTETCGSSSVSFGLARSIWEQECAIPYDKEGYRFLVLINNGTGGCKFQGFRQCREDLHMECVMEYKGKSTKAPNLNAHSFGGYVAKKSSGVSFDEDKRAGEAWFQIAAKEFQAVTGHPVWDECVGAFVFVTGPSREEWEKQSEPATRQTLEMYAGSFFHFSTQTGCPLRCWDGASFFMSQDQEAEMELRATEMMYRQLFTSALSPVLYEPCMTAGLGQGSMQWKPWTENVGLSSPTVNELPQRLKTKLMTTDLALEMLACLQQSSQYPKEVACRNIIAMKSLFLMALTEIPQLRQDLLDHVKETSSSAVVVHMATSSDTSLASCIACHEEILKDVEELYRRNGALMETIKTRIASLKRKQEASKN